MKEKTNKTFEKSLEVFGMVAQSLIQEYGILKNDRIIQNSEDDPEFVKEMRLRRLRLLLNEFRFESIDFLMKEVSPETRKEIMDCAWNGDFEEVKISSGKYIKDWFHPEDGSMTG